MRLFTRTFLSPLSPGCAELCLGLLDPTAQIPVISEFRRKTFPLLTYGRTAADVQQIGTLTLAPGCVPDQSHTD